MSNTNAAGANQNAMPGQGSAQQTNSERGRSPNDKQNAGGSKADPSMDRNSNPQRAGGNAQGNSNEADRAREGNRAGGNTQR